MAQIMNSMVLTPTGFAPLEVVEEGMELLDSFGRDQKVLAVRDAEVTSAYRVTTNDGFHVDVTEDHPWLMYDSEYAESREVTTEYMVSHPDEDYIFPKPNLTTYHRPDRVPGRVFSPTALGLMLREEEPTRGAVSLRTPEPEKVTSYIPTPPDYALATLEEFNKYKFVWESESLTDDPCLPWLLEANLLQGKYEEFRIPDEYLESSLDVRSDLVYALSGHPRQPTDVKWGVQFPHWEDLPLEHPRYGAMLRLLIASLSLHKRFTRRHVVSATPIEVATRVRSLELSSTNRLYVTDGFTVTKGLG